MKISIYLEENVLVEKFKSVKVGLTIHSDTELDKNQVGVGSQQLWELAKKNIKNQIDKIKVERGITDEC